MTDTNLLDDNGDTEFAVRTDKNAPQNIPEKFWDAEKKEIRVDALLKSYIALEKRMTQSVDLNDTDKMRRAMGVPDSATDYCIECQHGLFQPDDAVNEKLHEHGFSAQQAQLVYDLAAERLVPLIGEVAEQFQSSHEQERLIEVFGGADKWREVSRQLTALGQKNLPDAALKGLSASYEGVMALYKMMQSNDPSMLRADKQNAAGEQELHSMMQDPRYWQKKDPAFISQVTEGFKRIYSN